MVSSRSPSESSDREVGPMASSVSIELPDGVVLSADAGHPSGATRGLVVFAHGSGSSRLSPRNRAVASAFRAGGLATLLLDLLTPDEDVIDRVTRQHRFDITLLGERVATAIDWCREEMPGAPLGLFGASTGAAAALVAAAARPGDVAAVVSRGGRPDLAGAALAHVVAPTLLIVGGRDEAVLAMNREAQARMTSADTALEVISGASHLFEEPGALGAVADLAVAWFLEHLGGG